MDLVVSNAVLEMLQGLLNIAFVGILFPIVALAMVNWLLFDPK